MHQKLESGFFSDMGSGTTFEFEFTQGELLGHDEEEGGDCHGQA